jgi:hypothetical protein
MQTDRQTETETDRQRQTDKQTDRQRQRCRSFQEKRKGNNIQNSSLTQGIKNRDDTRSPSLYTHKITHIGRHISVCLYIHDICVLFMFILKPSKHFPL